MLTSASTKPMIAPMKPTAGKTKPTTAPATTRARVRAVFTMTPS
jgi:hypothetical protein